MVCIFRHVAGVYAWTATEDTFQYPKRLHLLAQVCRRWADIVKGTSELWESVDGRMSGSDLRAALELSKPRPLLVRYDQGRENWQALKDQLARWKQASIIAESRKVLKPLERKNGAPLLETLHISLASTANPKSRTLKLFGGVARALRHLTLR